MAGEGACVMGEREWQEGIHGWGDMCGSGLGGRGRRDGRCSGRYASYWNAFLYITFECHYHPRMRVGNVFSHVCLSVCLSVQAITFESLNIETSFLVCRYILTISRSSLSIKVIGSRSYEKK